VARTPNSVATVKIALSTTPAIRWYLESLVKSGLYGKNIADAAERLVARGVEALIRDGALQRTASGKSKGP
jgi:hypothetical protein